MNLRSSLLALSMLVGLGGCSVQPGQYVIVRLASAKTTESASCWDNMVPDSIKDDTTTLSTGSSVAIFAADAETYYLEHPDAGSVEGTRDGKDYSFFGEEVNVEENSTTTVTWDIQTTIDNKSVTGKSIRTETCTGDGCGIASCVKTTEFVGTIVKDVELEHGV